MGSPIVLLSGATSGIGRAEAIKLAMESYELILPVRNISKGELLLADILRINPQAKIHLFHCDLASFESITHFAEKVKSQFPVIDILAHNAGVFLIKRRLSQDGYEYTLAVNHLAIFLLTYHLLDPISKSDKGRIVLVSSGAHKQGKIDLADLQSEVSYNALKAYSQSKLANILFTRKLATLLSHKEITVNCLNPGMVKTDIVQDLPSPIRFLFSKLAKSPDQGTETLHYLITSDKVGEVTGEYFQNKKPIQPSGLAIDKALADKLWEESEQLTGIKYLITDSE